MITYCFAIELIFISKNNGVFPEKATDVKSVLGRSVCYSCYSYLFARH